MSIRLKRFLPGNALCSAKKMPSYLRYVVLAWFVVLLAGFWITRTEVRDIALPNKLVLDQTPASGNASQQAEQTASAPTESPDSSTADSGSQSLVLADELLEELEGMTRLARYASIPVGRDALRELASVVLLEASTQCMDGQQAVAEVVLNRVLAQNFPNTIHDVLYSGLNTSLMQFATAPYIADAEPTETQFLAVKLALTGPSVLPVDVVYFSKGGENEYVWGRIEDHVFCYQYPWALIEHESDLTEIENDEK